jgi:hypothetical protein
MKLSKVLHVLSVLLGFAGVILWILAIFASPAFGQPREVMLLCATVSLLTAIWLVVSALHHITLEKAGGVV